MNRNIDELCKDPLFQLNLAIWLAQAQPASDFYVNPLFYKSGLTIYSISPLLALPPDIRLTIADRLECQDGARPDLVLESTHANRKFCLLECKATSFGQDSSTSSQARTLLLISGPILSEVLGLGARGQNNGILCYLTRSDQVQLIVSTLESLSRGIENLNLRTGENGSFGIKSDQSAILIEYSNIIKDFLSLIESSPVKVLTLEENTDPRPIYFIPLDPNLQQTKEEQEFSRRILCERILSHIISKLGEATVPFELNFTTVELLNSATFNLYEIWEDNDAKKHIRKLVRYFLENIKVNVNEPLKDCISYESQKGWIINIKDKETHEGILKQVMKFKPETLDLSKQIDSTQIELPYYD